uniref:Uncharacterized protein n=1 Tax=Acrobeloides nanus TaxID=290746 RepID=A0A914CG61_9BILA
MYIGSWNSAVLKYFDGIFYMDDDTPFSKENPCSNNIVSAFFDNGRDIEIFENNLITKSQICCANWKPLNQLGPITTTRIPIAPEVNQVSQCSTLSVNYHINITGHTSNVSANIQFSLENSTTLFYITNISISNHIPGYDFHLFFLTDALFGSDIDFNPNPFTQNISIFNESEFAISMPGISQIGFGINGNYTTSPESIGELSFYKGNVLDKSTNGYYFDGWSNGWSNQCIPDGSGGYELEFKSTTCCINTASINSLEQTSQQTCRRFNAIIDWFTKDGIVFNELRANISAGFDDPDNKDTLTVISSKNYQILNDDHMGINLFIDRVLINLSSPQEGLSAVPNIGHFVFIDAYII